MYRLLFIIFFFNLTLSAFSQKNSGSPISSTAIDIIQNCQYATVKITEEDKATTWYWQESNQYGTSTELPITEKNVYQEGVYYVRSRSIDPSGVIWSDAFELDIYIYKPVVPGELSINKLCGRTYISKPSERPGYSLFWQSSENGTDTSNTAASLTKIINNSANIYLREKVNGLDCWGPTRTEFVEVEAITTPSFGSTTYRVCKGEDLDLEFNEQLKSNEQYVLYLDSETEIKISAGKFINLQSIESSHIYYVSKEKMINNGSEQVVCESKRLPISVSVIDPKLAYAHVANDEQCGFTELTIAASDKDFLWYWQGTDSDSFSKNILFDRYSVTSSNTYFIRGKHKDNSVSCWTDPIPIDVYVNKPEKSPFINTEFYCEETQLIRPENREGYEYYWQFSANGTDTTAIAGGREFVIFENKEVFLREKAVNMDCWSEATSVAGTLHEPTSIDAGNPVSVYLFEGNLSLRNTGESHENGIFQGEFVTNNNFYASTSGIGRFSIEYLFNDGICISRDLKVVNVLANPNISFNGENAIELGQTKELIVPSGFSSYEWYANGQKIEGANSFTFLAQTPASYSVRIESDNGKFFITPPVTLIRSLYSQNQNFIQSVRYRVEKKENDIIYDISEAIEQISYFDEIGQPKQIVSTQFSPNKNDLIQPVFYDDLGRESIKFLPYVANDKNGNLKDKAIIDGDIEGQYFNSDQYAFYDNMDDHIAFSNIPYSKNIYEQSSLNRIVKQFGPGEDWSPNELDEIGKPIQTNYLLNQADNIYLISYDSDILSISGFVDDGYLQKILVIDENGNKSATFSNVFGKTILKRNYKSNSEYADTYYVYDNYNRLVFVLPPELSTQLENDQETISADLLNDYAFQYTYDNRNRMISKKVPGSDRVDMVYDDKDRLVLTQDGNQRKENKWLFTKYDFLNRPIATGIYFSEESETKDYLTELLNEPAWAQNYSHYETKGNVLFGYTDNSFPTDVDLENYLTITYYDNYDFFHASQNEFLFIADELNKEYNNQVNGQVTGSMTKVLGTNSQWLRSINYYDYKYRPIQVATDNIKGGVDRISNQYDFIGKILKTLTNQYKPQKLILKNQVNIVPYGDGYKMKDGVSGWSARFSSVNRLEQNEDGWIETRIDETNSNKFFGLTRNDISFYGDQLFRVYMNKQNLKVFRIDGTYLHLAIIKVGDLISIQRINGIVSILVNGNKVYSFPELNNDIIYMDVAMQTGTKLGGVKTSFNIPQQENEIEKDIIWTSLTYTDILENGSLYKGTSGWSNANGSSVNVLPSKKDGALTFEAATSDKELIVGLSARDMGSGYNSIDYAIYLGSGGGISIQERGDSKGSFGTYSIGDKFKIARQGNIINYYKNDQLFYESKDMYSGKMVVDVALNTSGATLANPKVTFGLPFNEDNDLTITEEFTYDHADRLLKAHHELAEEIKWEGIVGYDEFNDGQLTYKLTNGYGGSGAYSLQFIDKISDGYLETEIISGGYLIGLNDDPIFTGFGDMEYAINVNFDKKLYVYRKGKRLKLEPGQPDPLYTEGDKIGIRKSGNIIQFVHNGVTFHQMALTEEVNLYPDVSSNTGAGDIINTIVSISGKQLMVENEYNELGQLITKNLHKDGEQFTQSVDYRYNIRGWLERINHASLEADNSTENPDLFGMELGYTNTLNLDGASAQYNGNISAMKWGGKRKQIGELQSVNQSAYAYQYDSLNRIEEANFFEGSNYDPNQKYNLHIPDYDLNGNIRQLQRKDEEADLMDNLTYTYKGNQLLYVSDAGNVDSGFKDGFINSEDAENTSNHDYLYDNNGNMIKDRNKAIDSISYNHLNLPATVFFENGDYINYIYDAAGIKLRQEVFKAGELEKATDYLGAMIYENDTLQFIQTAEGRIVPRQEGLKKQMEYQYHLKDHLGNVHTTFAVRDDYYNTSFETADHPYFNNYNQIEIINNNMAKSGSYSNRVVSTSGAGSVGITTSFMVSKGDEVNAEVSAKYLELANQSESFTSMPIITALGSMLSGGVMTTGENILTNSSLNNGLSSLAAVSNADDSQPLAFFNYILFDKDHNYIEGGFKQISAAAADDGTGSTEHELLAFDNIHINEDGYIMIYVSNETEQLVEVFFDDLIIHHHKTEVIQADDYYPFGLTFNSYQRSYSKANNYKYNGMELEEETQWYFPEEFRTYDPALGRFMQIDPVIKLHESPYAWNTNNPILYPDPLGSDSTQRANAVAQAKKFVDEKEAGNQYEMGGKGAPGEKVDCSGLVSNCVKSGGESDPNRGDKSSGVLNIESNTEKVDESDAVEGNIVTFRSSKGYPYHTGLVTGIDRDKDGNILKVNYIHSQGGTGPKNDVFEVGQGGKVSINGFYKWDTKPDKVKSSSNQSRQPGQGVPNWAKSNVVSGFIYFMATGIDPILGK